MKRTAIASILDNDLNVVKAKKVIFERNNKTAVVHIYLASNGHYLYDMNLDGKIDLQITPTSNENYSTVYYLDRYGNRISKASLIPTNNNINTIHIDTTFNKFKAQSIARSWRDCFESTAGSAEAVAIGVASSFFGPEATAAFYAGIALGCLL
ncbi:MAG TPA: hypothetical protein VK084_03085 [Chitinophagaceae bacterium]|nr:hypothetical protein [Chitinophagaceae bacterium]